MDRLRELALDVMAAMVVADGTVHDEEILALVQGSEGLPGGGVDEAEARALVERVTDQPVDAAAVAAAELDEPSRKLLFDGLIAVATADGFINDDELLLLTAIGEALDLDVLDGLVDLFEDEAEA